MTVADYIRSMTDMELAGFMHAIIAERDAIVGEQLARQGIQSTLIEFPAVSLANHLKYLQSYLEGGEEQWI